MPMSTWNYKAQSPGIRHLGPMAQDFFAAFGVGEDDKHIATVDADGVALAGVQALYRLSLKKDAQIRALKQQTEELKSHNRQLAQRVEELSKVQQAMPALEAQLERLEAQEQTTRARLARVARGQKKQAGPELARVRF